MKEGMWKKISCFFITALICFFWTGKNECSNANKNILDGLKEGYSKVDIAGDARPETIFLKRDKLPGTVSKLVILDTSGKLLFYLSTVTGVVEIYTKEEDIENQKERIETKYQKLLEEWNQQKKQESSVDKPIILDVSDAQKKKFKPEVAIEEKMIDLREKEYVLRKNGSITGGKIGNRFICVTLFKDYISLLYVNNTGRGVSDDLNFKWNSKNKKFEEITSQ